MCAIAKANEEMKRAVSMAVTYAPSLGILELNTNEAFMETKTNDEMEQIIVIPRYGPLESFGPSQKL